MTECGIEFHDSELHGFWSGTPWTRLRYTQEGYLYGETRGADGIWRPSKATWDAINECRAEEAKARDGKRIPSLWRRLLRH